MPYEPTEWIDKTATTPGTKINRQRMMKLEQGVKEAYDLAEAGGGGGGSGLVPDPDYPGYYVISEGGDPGTPVDYPPTITLGVSTDGLDATATFTASDPEGDPITVDIDWGDGQTTDPATSPTAHTYAAAGTYTITATATAGGKTGADTVQASVAPATTPTGYEAAVLDLAPVVHVPLSETAPPPVDTTSNTTPTVRGAAWGEFTAQPIGSVPRSYFIKSTGGADPAFSLGQPGVLEGMTAWSFTTLIRLEEMSSFSRHLLSRDGANPDRGFRFTVETDGSLRAWVFAASFLDVRSASGIVEVGVDHAVALTYAQGEPVRLYLDGAQVASATPGSPFSLDIPVDWYVGTDKESGALTQNMRGWIAMVDIYDKELSPAEVLDLASEAGLTGA